MTQRDEKVNRIAVAIANSSRRRPLEQRLETSERVLKRITDGIYRQPSSAIRELISNAYDADATNVIIETDSPRFKTITIRDNGRGFSEKALASLICNIGGSPKRTYLGPEMGVSQEGNPDLSPGGRKLIGKIGIGLFAVAQLTKEFKIITKVKGSNHRTIAHVKLHTHSEEELKKNSGDEYETGKSKIWREDAPDTSTHGTEIILLNLLPKTKEDLASKERWLQSYSDSYIIDEDDSPLPVPKYHIGCVLNTDENKIHVGAHYPWDKSDTPKRKFEKLIEAVRNETNTTLNPKIEELFDNYLKLLWTIGLQIPVSYIDQHPFLITQKDRVITYKLGNKSKSKAEKFSLKQNESISDHMKLETVEIEKTAGKFDVYIDGVKIFRPISYSHVLETAHAIKTPLIFVGKDHPDLSNIPQELRGGTLKFEAYLLWQPKVVPVEHRGVLIRINNSNGTLFDETFMKYPVSEQTRKNQITAEIFVHEGMDAALNIDRESFNYAHPHYQYLTKWLHNAFKQFATAHKKLGREVRETQLLSSAVEKSGKLEQFVTKKIAEIRPESELSPVIIEISTKPAAEILNERKNGHFIYQLENVLPSQNGKLTNKSLIGDLLFEKKLKSIAEVLAAYGLFDYLSYKTQEELLRTIAEIIAFEE